MNDRPRTGWKASSGAQPEQPEDFGPFKPRIPPDQWCHSSCDGGEEDIAVPPRMYLSRHGMASPAPPGHTPHMLAASDTPRRGWKGRRQTAKTG